MFTMLNNENASTLNTQSFSLLTMKTLAERLQWAIDQAGIKKIDLANACGISRGAVSQWFNGSTLSLEGSNLTNAAKVTGVNPHWLATGTGARKAEQFPAGISNVEPGPDISGKVPLISWVQAGQFCTAPDLLQPGDAEEWLPAVKRFGPHAYALRVVGDSMVLPYPSKDSFFPGTIIFVDPDKPLTNGAKVIAKIDGTEEATFKVYSEDGGKRYLKPQNPQYPVIEMDETMHICGVVVWQGGDV